MVDADVGKLASPRYVPMLVPPREWTSPDRGGFLQLRTPMMRAKGEAAHREALKKADLRQVYEGLNCLGKVNRVHIVRIWGKVMRRLFCSVRR